ncbi:TRAP transporter, DctM-like membrane protein [delta proteobacterium NaphS2]|nr:TRAP transporter, DctM-like membrane protein [delta proteobacterium NaphS2]
MPVGDMVRRSAERFPDKTAIIFRGKRIIYGELNRRVNALANRLLDMGGRKGDRVAVVLHNCPEYIEAYFACAKSGLVFVPINNLLKERELTQIIRYIEPRFLLLDSDFETLIETATTEMDFVEFKISLSDPPHPPFISYEKSVNLGDKGEPEAEISKDDVMSIFLTSGTTGLPKGAMRTHHQNFQNAMTCALEMKLVVSFPFPDIMIVGVMQLLMIVLGTFMEPVSIMMITFPVYMPIVKAFGFDPIWFGFLTLINMEIGMKTPPFGMVLFVMKGVVPSKTTMLNIYRSVTPFVAIDALAMLLIMIFPAIATVLPNLMKY